MSGRKGLVYSPPPTHFASSAAFFFDDDANIVTPPDYRHTSSITRRQEQSVNPRDTSGGLAQVTQGARTFWTSNTLGASSFFLWEGSFSFSEGCSSRATTKLYLPSSGPESGFWICAGNKRKTRSRVLVQNRSVVS